MSNQKWYNQGLANEVEKYEKRFKFKAAPQFIEALKWYYIEQIASAGQLVHYRSLGVPVTEVNTKPYSVALQRASEAVYGQLKAMGLYRGAAPKRRFSTNVKCDARCQNAHGPICECPCGGLGHGMNVLGIVKEHALRGF